MKKNLTHDILQLVEHEVDIKNKIEDLYSIMVRLLLCFSVILLTSNHITKVYKRLCFPIQEVLIEAT